MLRFALIFATLTLLLAPSAAVGQRLAPAPQSTLNGVRWPAAATESTQLRPAPSTLPRTYWLEGGVIGGVGLGVLTGLSVRGLCESSNCTGGGVAAGGLRGGVGVPARGRGGGERWPRADKWGEL